MAEAEAGWSPVIHTEPDGTCRVEIIDEDGVQFPIARQVTPGQARRLVERIAEEARTEGRLVKDVIRDPAFMAATVIMVKRVQN
jgi:hypothetical protein